MKLSETVSDFQEAIRELAAAHGKTAEQVYASWLDYADSCHAGDQSPVLGEFEDWYGRHGKDIVAEEWDYTYTSPREAIKRLRKVLKQGCKSLSVRMARGTAWGWIEISGSGQYGSFTDAEAAYLKSIGMNHGGNFACLESGRDQAYWLWKLGA